MRCHRHGSSVGSLTFKPVLHFCISLRLVSDVVGVTLADGYIAKALVEEPGDGVGIQRDVHAGHAPVRREDSHQFAGSMTGETPARERINAGTAIGCSEMSARSALVASRSASSITAW